VQKFCTERYVWPASALPRQLARCTCGLGLRPWGLAALVSPGFVACLGFALVTRMLCSWPLALPLGLATLMALASP
jgi:hypothetical protein